MTVKLDPMLGIKNLALLTVSVGDYWRQYFSNRRFPEDQRYYVVYTNLDHAIPFQPETASQYWLINFLFLPTVASLGNSLSEERFRMVRLAYRKLAQTGVAAFRKAPTIMPHFSPRNSAAVRAARTILKPINCCPSLHTASPLFLYHLGAAQFPEQEPLLRRYVGDIVSTVIQAKFHAMIDIAFGMLLTQRILENELKMEFNSLDSFFLGEQRGKDSVPYEHVIRIYHEITELGRTMAGRSATLPELMERYFQEIGLPRVKRQESACYYDLGRKSVAYPPELRVGKGLT